MVDGKAAAVGGGNVLVGSGGVARQAEHGVAVGEQALGGRVEHLVGEGVGRARAGGAQDGQGDPFPDDGRWPVAKTGQAAASRRARLTAMAWGSSLVPER